MKKKKKNTLSLIFLAGGLFLSGSIFTGSLYALYNPAFAEKATASFTTLSGNIDKKSDSELPPEEETDPGHAEPEGADNSAAGFLHTENKTIPLMEMSDNQGEIDDLIPFGDSSDQGKTYAAMLDTSMGSMLYYNQGDSRWGDYLYGGTDPLKKYGCGPTTIAMLVNSFTDRTVTPVEIADWAAANGYFAPQSGSYHSLIKEGLTSFGLNTESVKNHSYDNAAELLKNGHVLVALMGKGSLTDNGHFIIITKLLQNGNVQIADPNSYENSTKEWDLTQLLGELKKSSDNGAPLWSVTISP
ncbi:C39 family peptidase [Hungatella hathewayi]|uniref:C39 family peptidase n=1 Tax=Hungatella hathewayi TaxID=154046 RepID=UPI003567F65F